jgi:two-component sensor histidine kinase
MNPQAANVMNTLSSPAGFLDGGGEMGARLRAHDWSNTPLGPPEFWPQALKLCLRIMLASRQPMWVWWGPQLINFYNDAYLPIIGARHPGALGCPARAVWPEIWDQIRFRIDAAMAGESSYAEGELLVMERNGYPEETYYTFSFSPVPDDERGVGGIICASTDDTEKIIGARRLALLRDVASRTWDADSVDEVYALATAALADDAHDIPFALLYRLDADGRAVLKGAAGIAPGDAAAPEIVEAAAKSPWPISDVMRTGEMRRLDNLRARMPGLPSGPWPVPPDEALMLPLSTSVHGAVHGVLVAGVNPYRPRDGAHDDFLRLAARKISAAIVNTEALEFERERARAADVLALEIEHRRRIERHQNLLLDELNHRVKNTLATVQAIAMQTLKGADAAARDTFVGRLFALSSQHDLLTLDNWEGASLDGVVRRALRPWRDEDQARFKVEGPPVHLEPKRALALGMAFHELATNAARHGALSRPGGEVQVRWTIDPRGGVQVRWEEQGGPEVSAPARRGFGLRLIEHGLAREVSGTVSLSFAPQGLTCEWTMPLH